MSGKKVALVVIPVLVVTIALAAIFAFPGISPMKSVQNRIDTTSLENQEQVTPIASDQNCADISGKINTYVVLVDGMGSNETKKKASESLVDQYCQRPALVQEMNSLSNPALGLVAYACDAGSGKAGDQEFQKAIGMYGQAYCEGAFVAIYDGAEQVAVSVGEYKDQLAEDAEENGNNTASVDDKSDSQLQEITTLAKKAKSYLNSSQYYSAAKSLDSASIMFDELAQ